MRCLSNCCFSTFWFLLSSCFLLSLPASYLFFVKMASCALFRSAGKSSAGNCFVFCASASSSVEYCRGVVHELSTGCEEITRMIRRRSKWILQCLTAMQGRLPTQPSHFHMIWTDKINFLGYYFLRLSGSKELKNRHAIFCSIMASSLFSSTFAF